jgi:hypothetical protein
LLLVGMISAFTLWRVTRASASAEEGGFNKPGNVLIMDLFNNRVIEVDRHSSAPSEL